jgi:hypothetical protein
VESLLLALRAAVAHHHYLVARYRLAIQASTVAIQYEKLQAVSDDVKQEIERLFTSCRGGGCAAQALRKIWRPTPDAPTTETDETRVQYELVRFGQAQAHSLGEDLEIARLILGMLRRTERTATIDLFAHREVSLNLRRKMRDLAVSVELIAKERAERISQVMPGAAAHDQRHFPKARMSTTQLEDRARDPASGWQLAYNVACLCAIRAAWASKAENVDRAFEFLWKALERSGSDKLQADWIKVDPDLEALRNDPRYPELLRRLAVKA